MSKLGLAGLMVAQTCQPEHVEITDGNQNSIDNLQIVVKENEKLGLIKNVSYRVSTSRQCSNYSYRNCLFYFILAINSTFHSYS